MASDYTEGLGVELIGSGDKAGSWGDVTNNNLQALEEGISRYAEIAVTSAAADLDIPDASTAYSTDSKGRSSVIKWTGDPSNSTHTVTLKVGNNLRTQAKFTAVNSLTSPASLIISCGVGSNVTIPNGYSADVHIEVDSVGAATGVVNSLSSLSIDKLALGNQEVISNTVDDRVDIVSSALQIGDGSGDATIQADGTGNTNRDLVIRTTNLGSAGVMRFNDVAHGNIEITPGGDGSVVMPKVTISDGTIAGTVITNSSIGSSSPSTGAFTSLGASGTSTLGTVNAAAIGGTLITASTGLRATTGGLVVSAGGIISNGNTNLNSGGITLAGSISGASSITASDNIVSDSGNIQASNGNLGVGRSAGVAGPGNISAIGLISTSGNIETTGSGTISSAGRVTSGNGLNAGGTITGATDINASGTATANGFVAQTNGLLINAGGLTVNGTTNLNNGGITNAGALSSVTTVNSGGNAVTFGGQVNAGSVDSTGTITSGGLTLDAGTLNVGNRNISNAGTIAGVTTINATGGAVTFGGNIETTGTFIGDIQGGTTRGNVIGDVEGDVTGDVTGDVDGDVVGSISGGNVSGNGSGLTGTASNFTAGNVTTNAALTGDVETTSGNATRIASGVIVNDDINASAGISYSKMAASSTAPIWNQNTTGQAATVATNANMTGDVTSLGSNATTIAAGAVDGLKLNTATTPTDGYVLTATDSLGGMDWEASTVGDITRVNGGAGITAVNPDGPAPTLNIDAAQPTITSLGTLSGLTVTNPIAGSVTGSAATADSITGVTTGNIVQLTDTQILTNKTLTSPDINTPDIDGGTIDGVAINGSSIGVNQISTGRFTTVEVTSTNLRLSSAANFLNFGPTVGGGAPGLAWASSRLQISNSAADGTGQPYHANMTSGQGAYVEVSTAYSRITNGTFTFDVSSLGIASGDIPSLVEMWMKRTGSTADNGYVTNDWVRLNDGIAFGNAPVGSTISSTHDTVTMSIMGGAGSNGTVSAISKAASGATKAYFNFSNTGWTLVCKAWK